MLRSFFSACISRGCGARFGCRVGSPGSNRSACRPVVPETHPNRLKLQTIDPRIAEHLNRYASEFREIYFR
jgi:hypothetical protein